MRWLYLKKPESFRQAGHITQHDPSNQTRKPPAHQGPHIGYGLGGSPSIFVVEIRIVAVLIRRLR